MQDLLSRLRQHQSETLRLLETMVNMDSPSTDKNLVDAFVKFLGPQFQAIGGQTEVVHSDRFGDHLVVRFPGPGTSRVLLLGHTDTVFAAGDAARRPFRIENGRAKGPGVFDMKGGIALV